ncbi:MAG: glycosyltransferase [Cellvibrio sp.]|uniref:glycosyltransferase n=1 Tax=Cellvibrio sp. TaxID=1965322 RepID=UPI0031A2B1BC
MNKPTLFLCIPDHPFPARKNGISIRYQPIIEYASTLFDVHMLVVSDHEISTSDIAEAQKLCKKVSLYIRKPAHTNIGKKIFNRIKSFVPGNTPFPFLCYDEDYISNFIKQETRNIKYDVALCVLATYQHLVQKNVKANRFTLDLIDSPYATACRKQSGSIITSIDNWLIKIWERKALKSADYACYVSPLDLKIGAGKNIDHNKVGVIPNGLYVNDFLNETLDYGCQTIGYLGHMGYAPNIRAALRLYRIFKEIQPQANNSKLVIIGRDPAQAIKDLALDPAVIVTGTVDNIWPYVKGITVFAFPMEIGSGQQNKLLEAMGAGIPVVSSSLGNSGIGAKHAHELLEANNDNDIGNAILSLLKSEKEANRLAVNAKQFINQNYAWPAIYKSLKNTLLN